ncbi:MAG: hypothetical protein OSJ65_05260 [Bacilli bacterium]|nr:hypothetical protein [Bacilli bacterium]
MKREQAEIVAKEKAKVMVEYLEQFMMDEDTIYGVMEFASSNNRLVVDMEITKEGKKVFERGYDMGISSVYADILTREISGLLLESFLPSENFAVSEYACIKDHPTMSRDGFYVTNTNRSRVNVNFRVKNAEFSEIMKNHNARIEDYRQKLNQNRR